MKPTHVLSTVYQNVNVTSLSCHPNMPLFSGIDGYLFAWI
jgi:hypothetical protein